MGLFGSVLKLGVDVVTAPVSVAKDVVTLGGALTGDKEPATVSKVKDVAEDMGDIFDDIFG